jgi:hypothetical protein
VLFYVVDTQGMAKLAVVVSAEEWAQHVTSHSSMACAGQVYVPGMPWSAAAPCMAVCRRLTSAVSYSRLRVQLCASLLLQASIRKSCKPAGTTAWQYNQCIATSCEVLQCVVVLL